MDFANGRKRMSGFPPSFNGSGAGCGQFHSRSVRHPEAGFGAVGVVASASERSAIHSLALAARLSASGLRVRGGTCLGRIQRWRDGAGAGVDSGREILGMSIGVLRRYST